LSPSNVNGVTACDNWNNVIDRTTYYALYYPCSAANGQQLYTDSGLTTLIPNGWYSNGINYFEVVGGNGTLINSTTCPGTTTTSTSTTSTSTTTAGPTTTTTTTTTTQPPANTTTTSTSTSTSTTTTLAINGGDVFYGCLPQANPCGELTSNSYLYWSGPFGEGTVLYTDNALTYPWAGINCEGICHIDGSSVGSLDAFNIATNSNVVGAFYSNCSGASPTTTTTTAAPQCTYDGLTVVCDDAGTTTSTSTSTTTTTTSGVNYVSYYADKYACNAPNCGAFIANTQIAFPDYFTVEDNKWYSTLDADGYAYQPTSLVPSPGPGIVMYEGTFNTCGLACSI